MRMYNYDLAKKIINTFNDLDVLHSASLGMQEDWFWTGETIFENGSFKIELNEDAKIAGTNGSSWATPIIQLELKNGETEIFECFNGEWTTDIEYRLQKAKYCVSGCLSVPCQIAFNENEVKIFKG